MHSNAKEAAHASDAQKLMKLVKEKERFTTEGTEDAEESNLRLQIFHL
jgi:hypothetical protein